MDEQNSSTDPTTVQPGSGRRGSSAATRWLAGVGLVAILVVAGAWGAYASYEASRATFMGFLAVWVAVGASIVVALGLVVVAVIARFRHRPGLRRWLLSAAGLAVGGTLVGAALGPPAGYHYEPPIQYEGAGTVDLALAGLDADFVAHRSAPGTCTTRENSRAIASVGAVDLGSLNGARVTATLSLGVGDAPGSVTVDLGGESIPAGIRAPTWEGQASIDTDATGRTGTASFELPLAAVGTGVVSGGWPERLAGTLTWDCRDADSSAIAPGTELAATLTISTGDGRWAAAPDHSGLCDSGGVSGPIGELQGYSFTASLNFRTGDLWVVMDPGPGKDAPSGLGYVPSWLGSAVVSMPDDDWRAGTAYFTNLPSGVDPLLGPAPTRWPATLTGTLTWTCGG